MEEKEELATLLEVLMDSEGQITMNAHIGPEDLLFLVTEMKKKIEAELGEEEPETEEEE